MHITINGIESYTDIPGCMTTKEIGKSNLKN